MVRSSIRFRLYKLIRPAVVMPRKSALQEQSKSFVEMGLPSTEAQENGGAAVPFDVCGWFSEEASALAGSWRPQDGAGRSRLPKLTTLPGHRLNGLISA